MLNKDIAKVIGEISEISILINSETKDDVFVEIYGHVNQIEVRYYKGGWKAGADPTIRNNICYFSDNSNKEYKSCTDRVNLKDLKRIRDSLRKIYKNGRVSEESLEIDEVVTITKIKHFVRDNH